MSVHILPPDTTDMTFEDAAHILHRIVDRNNKQLAKYHGKTYQLLDCVMDIDRLSHHFQSGYHDINTAKKIVSDCRFIVELIDKGLVTEPLLLECVYEGRKHLLRGICNIFIYQYERRHGIGIKIQQTELHTLLLRLQAKGV